MNPLQLVVDIRRRRAKPAAVHLLLVKRPIDLGYGGISDSGIVTAQITPEMPIAALDLRPLHGLHVQIDDIADDEARKRELANAVARIPTALLLVTTRRGERETLHVRTGETTTTHLLP